MITILTEVARRRVKNKSAELSTTIQLSSFLMTKAVESMNLTLAVDKQIPQDLTMNQFDLKVDDTIWTVRNRAYRDDTNDIDVEQVLYERAIPGSSSLKIDDPDFIELKWVENKKCTKCGSENIKWYLSSTKECNDCFNIFRAEELI